MLLGAVSCSNCSSKVFFIDKVEEGRWVIYCARCGKGLEFMGEMKDRVDCDEVALIVKVVDYGKSK